MTCSNGPFVLRLDLVFIMIFSSLDGIIIGASRLEHVINNIAVCGEGPLDDSEWKAKVFAVQD